MIFDSRMRGIIFSVVIIILGIIHFGVGVGIARRYHKYHEIFEQTVGLSGFNIFIGFFVMVIGTVGLVSVVKQMSLLSKGVAIAAFVFGFITFASLVTALALSGQAASHFRESISDNMNDYIQKQDAIEVINTLQSSYQCCGVNLWLDWSRVQLGGTNVGRRRRDDPEDSPPPLSPLTQAIRRKRQVITPGSIYNLPSSYTITLPASCCRGSSGVTSGNSLGGYCTYNANNGSGSFYVSGCLEPVCNSGFSQLIGIAVINTCLVMLAFVYFAKMIKLIPRNNNSNNEQGDQSVVYQGQHQLQQYQQYQQDPYGHYYTNDKQQPYQYNTNQQQQQQQQQQQYSYDQYYMNNKQVNQYASNQQQYPYDQYYSNSNNSNPYYIQNTPAYQTYH